MPSRSTTIPDRWPGAGCKPASGPESACSCRVAAQGAEEVDLAERGPVRFAEIQLGVGALPEQEVGEALLSAGADHEVGVGTANRVQVSGDVVGGQVVRNGGHRQAGLVCLDEQISHCVNDL